MTTPIPVTIQSDENAWLIVILGLAVWVLGQLCATPSNPGPTFQKPKGNKTAFGIGKKIRAEAKDKV